MPYPTPDPRNFLLGKGKCYFDRFDTAAARTGLRHLGNCTAVAVQTEGALEERLKAVERRQNAADTKLWGLILIAVGAAVKWALDLLSR